MPVPGYWDDHLEPLKAALFWSAAQLNTHRKMFPSLLDVLGKDAVAEIPGMLRLADIPRFVRTAGRARVMLVQPPPGAGS